MTDTMHENVDLLSLVESQFEEQNIIDAISESEMAMSLYDYQAFLVEQDTNIFMELKYDVLAESVVKDIWEIVKKIFKRIIELLNRFKEYVTGFKTRLKNIKERYDKYKHSKTEENILRDAAKKDSTMLISKIVVTKEALDFIGNYKSLSSCSLLQNVMDAVSEFIDFSVKHNGDSNINNELFLRECPSFAKIESASDGDASKILPMILDDLKLPYKNEEFNIDDIEEYVSVEKRGCTIKEFHEKYFKNSRAADEITTKLIKNDDSINDGDKKFNDKLHEQWGQLARIRLNVQAYRPMAAKFMKLNNIIAKLCNYRSSFYMKILVATMEHNNNMLTCAHLAM